MAHAQLPAADADRGHRDARALSEVSLDVAAGTFLVLLGPAGLGQDHAAELPGIEQLSSGRITIGRTVVADGRAHVPPERRDLSMVFQDYALWPHLTVLDNVGLAALADQVGERVGLRFDPAGCHVFPAPSPNGSPAASLLPGHAR